MHNTTKKIISAVLVFTIIIGPSSIITNNVNAQSGGGGGGGSNNAIPISTNTNWHNIQQQLKDFTWNALAWNVAKIALQQLTSSIVNWINSGFEGSPAFITNPEGYFLDLGDQITGNFISEFGPLQNLCSPWNIDIRLAIGLGQTRSYSERYSCTLGTIIGNARNASVNGYSIEGFIDGDFSQGSWPAFIALTNEPQNNIYGTYLQAKSDLESQITGKQQSVRDDLTQGQGFLSWSKCTDISEEELLYGYGASDNELSRLGVDGGYVDSTGSYGYGERITSKTDAKTGKTGYQSCSVQTPGSVISASLNKSLGSSIDQLNLADSINEITSALFAQLINQVVTRGLGGTTQRTSGTTQSFINQLYNQSVGRSAYENDAESIKAQYRPYVSLVGEIAYLYDQAVKAFVPVRATLDTAEACYKNIIDNASSSNYQVQAQNGLNAVGITLISEVEPTESTYKYNYSQAADLAAQIRESVERTDEIVDAETMQKSAAELQAFTSGPALLLERTRATAQSDIVTANSQASTLMTKANEHLSSCRQLENRAF